MNINKSELIDCIASSADISKAAAARALEAFLDTVSSTLSKGGIVSLMGFGTFSTRERKARDGRNPKTGETIKIKASKVPAFKPGIGLKKVVQN